MASRPGAVRRGGYGCRVGVRTRANGLTVRAAGGPPGAFRGTGGRPRARRAEPGRIRCGPGYLAMARLMTMRWISLVPSKIV